MVQGSGTPQAVTADGQGRFAFKDLIPGTYRLTVTRDGFVPAEHGQRGPNSPGVPVTLETQQQFRNVRISMTESTAIAGRVRNTYGEPSVNATVQALRYTYQEGRRTLNTVQSVRTNDLGEYRLFWLPPGQYVVSAQPMDAVPAGSGETLFLTGVGARGAAPPLGTGGITRIVVTGPGPGAGGGAAGAPPSLPMQPPPLPMNMGRGTPVAESTEVSLPVFFSNTTDAGKAVTIDLRPGTTFGGVDLTVVEARAVRLRGQAFAGGQPARGATVSIFARGGSFGGFSIRSATASDTGAFEFRGLGPGSYELVATLNAPSNATFFAGTPLGTAAGIAMGPGGAMTPMPSAPSAPRMAARAVVDVFGTDIENVLLNMDTGFTLAGRVTVEGRAGIEGDPALANVRVQLQSDPNIPPLQIPTATLEGNGTFSIAGITPGNYRLSVSGLPRNTYVRSARLGGADMLNGGLPLDRDPRGTLEVVLGTTPGTVEVMVTDDKLTPAAGVTVVLIPEASQQKRYDVYRNATSDSSGRVRLEGIVPGDYRVYAWEEVETNAWTDADFMRNFENRGTGVRIGDGGRATADVRVIPYKLN